MADDEGLNHCLVEHTKMRNVEVLDLRPVAHPTKKRGIVDLMFAAPTGSPRDRPGAPRRRAESNEGAHQRGASSNKLRVRPSNRERRQVRQGEHRWRFGALEGS